MKRTRYASIHQEPAFCASCGLMSSCRARRLSLGRVAGASAADAFKVCRTPIRLHGPRPLPLTKCSNSLFSPGLQSAVCELRETLLFTLRRLTGLHGKSEYSETSKRQPLAALRAGQSLQESSFAARRRPASSHRRSIPSSLEDTPTPKSTNPLPLALLPSVRRRSPRALPPPPFTSPSPSSNPPASSAPAKTTWPTAASTAPYWASHAHSSPRTTAALAV